MSARAHLDLPHARRATLDGRDPSVESVDLPAELRVLLRHRVQNRVTAARLEAWQLRSGGTLEPKRDGLRIEVTHTVSYSHYMDLVLVCTTFCKAMSGQQAW